MQGKSIAAIILGVFLLLAPRGFAQSSNLTAPLSATTIPQTELVQPAELAQMLKTSGAARPVVIQVGSLVMFQQAHIKDAKFAGPGSQSAGLALLKKLSAPLAKNQLIVIYCGCCPWGRCPNMGPAYKQLHDEGCPM